jgi:uncharacterized protein
VVKRVRAAKVKTVKRSVEVTLEADELRLAVVADTHSEPHPKSMEWIATERPHAILHAGDIGDLAVIETLRTIAPTHPVRGNIDVHAVDLPDDLTVSIRAETEDDPLFTIFLTHIAVYGPKLRAEVAKRARADGAAIVVCGHSHVPFIGKDQGLAVFNPGSIGPRRFHLPIVFGMIDVKGRSVTMRHVDCETGKRWLP